ncbi:MAG: FecR domain-containing protein [Odoribacter sp.]
MMKKGSDRIAELLALYYTGELSDAEKQLLEEWLQEDERHSLLLRELMSPEEFIEKYRQSCAIDSDRLLNDFENRVGLQRRKRFIRMVWAAAVAVLVLGVSISLLHNEWQKPVVRQVAEVALPGKAATVLLLGDGRKVTLSPGDSMVVNLPESARLTEKQDGLVYSGNTGQSEKYNTLQVPRGGEYKIVLSDGTYVHLNAYTELRYPVTFSDSNRIVYLSGEAWFEVKKDSEHPFYVKTEHMQVQVYGTAFAVNTLFEGQTTVALVNGSVGVSADGKELEMQPSQLACYNHSEHLMEISEADLAPYTAWRKGLLVFDDQPLEQILNRLALWYDIEVFYANESVRRETFTGYLKRYDSIGVILKALQRTIAVRFELKGRTLIVS